MPIAGGTVETNTLTLGGTAYSFNASNYSHSTVFSILAANDTRFSNLNVAELTTVYTPSAGCADRWVLAGGQTVTTGYTIQITTTDAAGQSPTEAPQGNYGATEAAVVLPSAGQEFTSPKSPSSTPSAIVTSSGRFLPRQNSAHNYTILSMALNGTATDPSYRSCQRYSVLPTYSPGICPSGQTVAEVTAWRVNASTGHHTYWQASCCRSGMTFGSEFYRACISTFSTPMEAIVLLTTSESSSASPTLSYEFTTSSWVSPASTYSTWTICSTTTLSTGLAVADPAVIAWQDHELKEFPSDYVASLAKRFEIALPLDMGPLSPPTDTPSPGPSAGAKIGIGVGAAVGVLIATIAVVLLLLKRRRKKRAVEPQHTIPEMADQDQDLAKKKWWAGGKWRSEADTQTDPQELENKTVHVVPGPPAELDAAELRHPDETDQAVYSARDRSFVET